MGDICLFSSLALWHLCSVRDGGGILGCGSQASQPSRSCRIPSTCPIMPTSATRASHCRPYIMSHCPEGPAFPRRIPGPGLAWAMPAYSRGWSPGKAKIWALVSSPTFHESNQCASHKEPYNLVWSAPSLPILDGSRCVPADDPGRLYFFFFPNLSGCLLGLTPPCVELEAAKSGASVLAPGAVVKSPRARPHFSHRPLPPQLVIASLPELSRH